MPLQDQITNFYDNFGMRLHFMRQARGLTLSELSSGSASTAQSWETGIYPRTRKWREISEKLGLSEPFIFKGIPAIASDYEFIRMHRSEIGDPPPTWAPENKDIRENAGNLLSSANLIADASTVLSFMRPWFDAMIKNPNIAPYVLGELKKHLPHEDLRIFEEGGNS